MTICLLWFVIWMINTKMRISHMRMHIQYLYLTFCVFVSVLCMCLFDIALSFIWFYLILFGVFITSFEFVRTPHGEGSVMHIYQKRDTVQFMCSREASNSFCFFIFIFSLFYLPVYFRLS